MHCPKARCSAIGPGHNPGLASEKPQVENVKAPDYGAFDFFHRNTRGLRQNWHAPCINPITTQFRGPWYRQAGDSPL